MKYLFLSIFLTCGALVSIHSMDIQRELAASELYESFGLKEDNLADTIGDFLEYLHAERGLQKEDMQRLKASAQNESQQALLKFCNEKETGLFKYVIKAVRENKCAERAKELFGVEKKAAFGLIQKELEGKVAIDSEIQGFFDEILKN